MATRHKPTFDDRVKEYVDSPMMTQRLRHERIVTARIDGNFGVYRTTVDLKAKKLAGECTCPSEVWPCKHLHALRATWKKNPDSFFDFDNWLAALAKEPNETLVEAIRNMVLHSPSLLTVFGVAGFEEFGDDDEYDRDDYDD
jgi:hypothetical protein